MRIYIANDFLSAGHAADASARAAESKSLISTQAFCPSTQLRQKLTNVSCGRTAGLNSPNCLFLSLSCSFRCSSQGTRATQSVWVTLQSLELLERQAKDGLVWDRDRGCGLLELALLLKAILVRLGPSSPKPWHLCSSSAHGQLRSLIKHRTGGFQVYSSTFPGPGVQARSGHRGRYCSQ